MATAKEITAIVDAEIEPLLATLATEQAKRVAQGKKCFQGLATHAEPPKDGAKATPDRKAEKPAGKNTTWDQFVSLPATMGYSLRVDEYVTPHGEKGWVATATVEINKAKWSRSVGQGPEDRDRDWHEEESLS